MKEPYVTERDEAALGIAYDMLEAADLKTLYKPERKGAYVTRMLAWPFPLSAFNEAANNWVDNNDRMPTISQFYTAVSVAHRGKQMTVTAMEEEMKSRARNCYHEHVYGLCAGQRGKKDFCSFCEAEKKPGCRPETFDEFREASKEYMNNKAQMEEVFKHFQKRTQKEQAEDMNVYRKRSASQMERVG